MNKSMRTQLSITGTVAQALLDAGCVEFRTDEPFRLPSGWASPVYMDCRRLISFSRLRRELVERSLDLLRERGCLTGLGAIVGAESSGIALAAWLADALDLPLQYVRKKSKGIGPGAQIEGVIERGDRVLLVDDLMAAGHSKHGFCQAIAAAGATFSDIFVLFDYGTFPTQDVFEPWPVRVHSLATWRDVLEAGRSSAGIDRAALDELERFLEDPSKWSHQHGGIPSAALK
jgi:orotate phosphoribosyltransferase